MSENQSNMKELPAYVSSDALAEWIGCTKRTVNRWLLKHPDIGFKVHSASGKKYNVLTRDDAYLLASKMYSSNKPKGVKEDEQE